MATKLVSPTTTATISLSSGDITSNPLNINCNFQLRKAGTRTEGLDNFTGVSRRSHGSTTVLRVIDEADFGKDGNSPTDADNLLGRVYEGNAFLIPYAGHLDVFVGQSVASMEYEIALFSE